MEDAKRKFRERVYYVECEGGFVGHCVNIPVVAQAETLDELQRKLRLLAKMWIKFESETIEDEDGFELMEDTHEVFIEKHINPN